MVCNFCNHVLKKRRKPGHNCRKQEEFPSVIEVPYTYVLNAKNSSESLVELEEGHAPRKSTGSKREKIVTPVKIF